MYKPRVGINNRQLNEKCLCVIRHGEKPKVNMIYRKNRFSQNKTSASLKLLTTASALALVGCGGGTGESFFVLVVNLLLVVVLR